MPRMAQPSSRIVGAAPNGAFQKSPVAEKLRYGRTVGDGPRARLGHSTARPGPEADSEVLGARPRRGGGPLPSEACPSDQPVGPKFAPTRPTRTHADNKLLAAGTGSVPLPPVGRWSSN